MILLDTTVLVYSVGGDHALRRPCAAIITAVAEERLRTTTTVEVIQEFAHVRARRRGREDAARLASDFAELLRPLVVPDDADLGVGLELFARNDRLGAFDAVLAATVSRRPHLTALVSADRAFAEVRGVRHLVPAEVDVPDRRGAEA